MNAPVQLHADLQALVGTTIHDRYEVEALLGSGGMGAVFRARHTGLQRGVAIKVLHPEIGRDDSVAKRFEREAHSASRLDHPNCVRVTDFGTTPTGTKYLVMELLEGEGLDARLSHPNPPEIAVPIIRQVLLGLEHAHQVGVVHRDLKPENIFLSKGFNGEVVKIVDFGIAKLIDEQGSEKLTRQGIVFGTPRYMSPEQAAGGKIDERTDLYALGLIFYELLAGHPPFQTDDAAQLLRMQIMAPPPPLPAGLPEALVAIVDKLLEKSKADRFASAREVLDALAQLDGFAAASMVGAGGSMVGVAAASSMVGAAASMAGAGAASTVPAAPASSGAAWQPAAEPTPAISGVTVAASAVDLAAVSMRAGASSSVQASPSSSAALSQTGMTGASMVPVVVATPTRKRGLPLVLAAVGVVVMLIGMGAMATLFGDDATSDAVELEPTPAVGAPADPPDPGAPVVEPVPDAEPILADPFTRPTRASPPSKPSSKSIKKSNSGPAKDTSDTSKPTEPSQPAESSKPTGGPTGPSEPDANRDAAGGGSEEPSKADEDKPKGHGRPHDKGKGKDKKNDD